ncbi:PTS sugar transporter subunit IIA [Entomospira entomophila]|uniref:PTS sugar transporter subunit IIA n=1 Tax=Entomospira entomophila TaxID=2719988 RepID=A0A968KR52_9SPIO|nr:PTS sugar transporter subunit IIA [Entomospira entomophilus]NIZ40439.1 PTS sugar transporter subunit IIA [Entomospira entomophilus]WDI35997.1 PTS sugar transporter subunit IIA [Entomospira entomophilus]
MNIMRSLNLHRVKAPLKSTTKEEVLRELIDLLVEDSAITDGQEAYEAVLAREQKGSTGLGEEIAIPHAKTTAVSEVAMAVGVSSEGIEFASLDGKPAKIFFLILANPEYSSLHIEALSEIASITRDEQFRVEILGAKSSQDIMDALKIGG